MYIILLERSITGVSSLKTMSCSPVLVATIIYSILIMENADGRKPFAFYEGVNCLNFDRNYIVFIECWLMPNEKGQLTMSAVLVLKQDLTHIMAKFQFIVDHNARNVTYLSLDLNICNALGALFHNPLMRFIASEVRRVSNFPLDCPLKKGVKYVLNNFTINSKFLPPFTPVIRWISKTNFSVHPQEMTTLQYDNWGRVVHKSKRD